MKAHDEFPPANFGKMPEGMPEPDIDGMLSAILRQRTKSLAAHLWAAWGGYDPAGFIKMSPQTQHKWKRVENWIRYRVTRYNSTRGK